jgi:hypothetical protein
MSNISKTAFRLLFSVIFLLALAWAGVAIDSVRKTSLRVSVGNEVMVDQLKPSDEAAVKAEAWQATRPDGTGYLIPILVIAMAVGGLYIVWRGAARDLKDALDQADIQDTGY